MEWISKTAEGGWKEGVTEVIVGFIRSAWSVLSRVVKRTMQKTTKIPTVNRVECSVMAILCFWVREREG